MLRSTYCQCIVLSGMLDKEPVQQSSSLTVAVAGSGLVTVAEEEADKLTSSINFLFSARFTWDSEEVLSGLVFLYAKSVGTASLHFSHSYSALKFRSKQSLAKCSEQSTIFLSYIFSIFFRLICTSHKVFKCLSEGKYFHRRSG